MSSHHPRSQRQVPAEGLVSVHIADCQSQRGYEILRQMKSVFVAILLLENLSVFAQTNTDSNGYVTNAALLFPFTLTNSVGDVITNAVLVKLTPNKFIYKTPDGVKGMMPLQSLSKNLQEKFGYDPKAARAADLAEQRRKEREQQFYQQQVGIANQQAIHQAALKKVLGTDIGVGGHIVQKIDAGVLVSAWEVDGIPQIVLLKDFPDADKLAAGDYIEHRAFNVGIYSYTTVNHSETTVHVYTCSTNAAVEFYLNHH
jgi:hypothetical protein